jgi:hypothetical protein
MIFGTSGSEFAEQEENHGQAVTQIATNQKKILAGQT